MMPAKRLAPDSEGIYVMPNPRYRTAKVKSFSKAPIPMFIRRFA